MGTEAWEGGPRTSVWVTLRGRNLPSRVFLGLSPQGGASEPETARAGLAEAEWPALQPVPHRRASPPRLSSHPRPGRQAHGEGHQVAIGNSKQQHESDEVGVLREEDGQPGPVGHVAQHEEWHKENTQADQQGQQPAILIWLRKKLG